jgi:hypothetical protein
VIDGSSVYTGISLIFPHKKTSLFGQYHKSDENMIVKNAGKKDPQKINMS